MTQQIIWEDGVLIGDWMKEEPKVKPKNAFDIPKHYIQMCCDGLSNGCLLTGEGGIGKSRLVTDIIKQRKIPYAYLNTFVTPLALYKFMYRNKDKLIILDDVDGLWENRVIALLKAALWEVGGKRVVNWESTSSKLDDIPLSFEFTGQIIILANKLEIKDVNIRAVVTRINHYEFKFSYGDKIEVMKEIITKPYDGLSYSEREYVLNKLIECSNENTKNFNFRTLIKAFNLYIYDMDKFDVLVKEVL